MTDVPVFPLWLTTFLATWAAVGPLLGIFIGHYLVRSWERKRWLADRRTDEFRRVLTSLDKLNGLMIEFRNTGNAYLPAIKEAADENRAALNTSLFITDFLETSQVMGTIIPAVRRFTNGGSFDDYQKEYWKAINLILEAAKKSAL